MTMGSKAAESTSNAAHRLELFKAGTAFLAVVLAALIGGWFAWGEKDAELSHQYVSMAVGILQKPTDSKVGTPLSPHEQELRRWAVALLDVKAPKGAKLTEEAKAALIDGAANIGHVTYTPPQYTHFDSDYVKPILNSGYVGSAKPSQAASAPTSK